MKKKITMLLICIVGLVVANPAQPSGYSQSHTNDQCALCSKTVEPANSLKPNGPNSEVGQPTNIRATYTLAELAAMDYQEAVNAIVALGTNWKGITDLWKDTPGAREFYNNDARMAFICNDLKDRFTTFSETDSKGLFILVEVLRAGSYLGYGNEAFSKLNTWNFKETHYAPAILAATKNTKFALGTAQQIEAVRAAAALMGSGYCSATIAEGMANLNKEYAANFTEYSKVSAKANGWFAIQQQVKYGIELDLYNNSKKWDDPSLSGKFTNYLASLKDVVIRSDFDNSNVWAVSAAIFYYAYMGQSDRDVAVPLLNQAVKSYPRMSDCYMDVIFNLDDFHEGLGSNEKGQLLTPQLIDEIKTELKSLLFTQIVSFEGGKYNFKVGPEVSVDKIRRMYWSIKEIESHFFRVSGSNKALEPGKADSVLTAYVYGTKSKYVKYQYPLFKLTTNNGGIYIEKDGTFYTFERTPQESSLTVEELFRHEYNHYLQNKHLAKGLWSQGAMYAKDRMVWFEEGGAEFLAGSTRLNGVISRKNCVSNFKSTASSRPSFAQALATNYNTDAYTYTFASWDYLYNKQPESLLKLVELCMADDVAGWDSYIAQIGSSYSTDFTNYMQTLYDNKDNLLNIVTPDSYIAKIPTKDNQEIVNHITTTANLQNSAWKTRSGDLGISVMEITGTYTLGATKGSKIEDWKAMNVKLNDILTNVTAGSWSGFATYSAYFVDYKVVNGNAQYTLVFTGMDGTGFTDISEDKEVSHSLLQNYPNPFNPTTTISFNLNKAENIKLSIFNTKGELVKTLINGMANKGQNIFTFDGTQLSSGVYFYNLLVGNRSEIKKMVLMK